jgi:hypothetical protein
MPNIRAIGIALAILGATLASAWARDCGPQGSCKTAPAPLRLSQFLTPGGSAAAKHPGKTHHAAAKQHARVAAKAASRPAAAEAGAPKAPLATAEDFAPIPSRSETDGSALASHDEATETDTGTDTVQVVAANEVNEIDLLADANSAPTPGGAMVENQPVQVTAAPAQPPADNAWLWQVFAALGGILAVGSAARLLIA